jgi:Radical SAM superfamily
LIRRLLDILREPVRADTRANLARSWARVPAHLRVARQMLGRAGNGCGATIGAMPRCDFACSGCYLGEGANRVPALSLGEVKDQIRQLRPALGHAGNLQLTDGEITLRPEDEVIELLRFARSLDLIPMLMTHGDAFRRRPSLLERLVVEGGLTEVSVHIDTTQRGRLGSRYRNARTEEELNPLRDEFAALFRAVTLRTGRQLRGATTMTVTGENLAGVPTVIGWLARNADVFRLVSFQPVAQVGRTEPGLGGGVSMEALWDRIALGFDGPGADVERFQRGLMWVGHPDCSRYLAGAVAEEAGGPPRFHPVRSEGDPLDQRAVDGFLERYGGISFRLDGRTERFARWAAVFLHAPAFVLGNLPTFVATWLRRLSPEHPWRFGLRLLGGRASIRGLVVISHHFMSRDEVLATKGQERLGLCVFHVPLGDRLVPMCEANTMGLRDRMYHELSLRGPRSQPRLGAGEAEQASA